MDKEPPRMNINFYRTRLGEAILFNAVSENAFGNLFKEGAYEQEKVLPKILDFFKKYGIKKVYLRSYIPQEPEIFFRTVENSFLTQIGKSLKEQGLEAKVILN